MGLICCIAFISVLYYELNEKYDELEIKHEYAIEMSKICLDDSILCDNIKKEIFKSKKQNPLV